MSASATGEHHAAAAWMRPGTIVPELRAKAVEQGERWRRRAHVAWRGPEFDVALHIGDARIIKGGWDLAVRGS